MRIFTWAAVAVGGLVACGADEPAATSIDTTIAREPIANAVFAEGNPTCADLGLGAYAFKVDPPLSGVYGLDVALGGTSTVTVVVDGASVDWSASLSIDAVIVKGGPNANVYVYDPEATSGHGLTPPINENTGQPYGLSHIEFCFDYELAVTKTAATAFDRTYDWSIDKTSTITAALLATGETLPVPYSVAVVRGYTDANWRASGTIEIRNPAPFAATITAIDDTMGAPICPFTLPFELAALATVTCTYGVALPGPAPATNTVAVATCGPVGPGSASAAIDFATAVITEIDPCVDVTDDHAGPLGRTCADATFGYTLQLGPYETCGTTEKFVNTASFVTSTSGKTRADSWTVDVTIASCEQGCTLTPGYWKTHSSYGPAPEDDAWLRLPEGPNTVFFLSGASYHDVLWTPPATNPYYILARAYIGAELNQLDGASGAAVATAMADAQALLQAYTPAEIASLRRNSAIIQRLLADATVLDNYNNGLIGPGHCSE